MNKLYTFLVALLLTATTFAQTPEKISYQAVVRDSGDALVTNQAVGMQISILQTTATGTAVYVETQTPTTNVNGLVTLEIGTGTFISGDFTTIDWSVDSYFIKTETDPTGGSSYTITGTSQLLSVPYALHAKSAKSIANSELIIRKMTTVQRDMLTPTEGMLIFNLDNSFFEGYQNVLSGEILDQDQPANGQRFGFSGISQSFTSGVDGELSSISLILESTDFMGDPSVSFVYMQLYEGIGLGGLLLGQSVPIVVYGTSSTESKFLFDNVPLTTGQQYTFVLAGQGDDCSANGIQSDVYSGGSTLNWPGYDLEFKTYYGVYSLDWQILNNGRK